MLAFEDNCFCFQVTSFIKSEFLSKNVYKGHPLFDKNTCNWKNKSSILQKLAVVVFRYYQYYAYAACKV